MAIRDDNYESKIIKAKVPKRCICPECGTEQAFRKDHEYWKKAKRRTLSSWSSIWINLFHHILLFFSSNCSSLPAASLLSVRKVGLTAASPAGRGSSTTTKRLSLGTTIRSLTITSDPALMDSRGWRKACSLKLLISISCVSQRKKCLL